MYGIGAYFAIRNAVKAFNPEAKISDFSEVELSQIQFTIRGAMQYFQAQWAMSQEGMLPAVPGSRSE